MIFRQLRPILLLIVALLFIASDATAQRPGRRSRKQYTSPETIKAEQDSLIKHNDRYHALLDELGVAHRYETSEGNHSWRWWDLHIQDALDYLLAE